MYNNNWKVWDFIKAKLIHKILQGMDIAYVDLALSLKKEILFTPLPETRLIYSSTTSMETKTVLDMYPNIILAIHTSKRNELLLGLRYNGQHFPVTGSSTRQVSVLWQIIHKNQH